jgi:alanyl aminopeptidase
MNRRRICSLLGLAFALVAATGPARAAAVKPAVARTAASGSDLRANGFRLGDNVRPTEESVRLDLDPAQPSYSGSVDIALAIARPTRDVRLHARDMTLTDVALTRAAAKSAPIVVTRQAGDRGLLTLHAARPLAAGAYRLTIAFTTAFNTQATSLYRLKSGGDWYAFTQFEADDARAAFPCFDEPEFKIPWHVSVVVPREHLVIGNTPVANEFVAGDKKTVEFKVTRPLPSYLIAVCSGPLETVPIDGLAVPGRVVTVKGASKLAAEAARVTPLLVSGLESYFGRPYPYEKLDLIAVPEFWPGAMENAGAITFTDRSLLMDPARASVAERRQLAEFISHELSHQWFGDLVTMDWWDDLWLNESFATWMGQKTANQVFPDLGFDLYEVNEAHRAMLADGRLTTRAIRQPVTTMANLLQSADVLAYQKGETVLGMFEHWMGDTAFRTGVRDYLSAHAWGNAQASDLWAALGKAGGHDVARAMATFLDQPGMPLVTIGPVDGGKVRISQERFLPAGARRPPPQVWEIPLVVKYQDGGEVKTKSLFLATASEVVDLGAAHLDWVLPNADAYGYYRWRVPEAWMRAIADRAAAALNARERMDFAYNARGLLDAGVMHADEYLDLLPRVLRDPEPLVVSAGLDGLGEVREPLITPEAKTGFARYVRGAVGPALEHFGRTRQADEKETVALVRPQLLSWMADAGQDGPTRAFCDSVAHAYLANPSAVEPSIAAPSMEVAAMRGDLAMRDTLRARFEAAPNPGQRRLFLTALIAMRDSACLAANLEYALSGPLKPQETGAFLRAGGVNSGGENRDRIWSFLQSHWGAIMKKVPPMYAVFMPFVAGGCSSQRLDEAEKFFTAPAHAAPGLDKELERLSEGVGDCQELREREGARARSFLERSATAAPTP